MCPDGMDVLSFPGREPGREHGSDNERSTLFSPTVMVVANPLPRPD